MNYSFSAFRWLSFSFLLVLVIFLSPCRGNTQPLIKPSSPYSVGSQHTIPDNDIIYNFTARITPAPDGGLTLDRSHDKKHVVVEHYQHDSLGVDWSIRLDKREDESWDPGLVYRDGKLYCAGLDYYSNRDSLGLRFATIDPVTRQVVSEKWGFRDRNDFYVHSFRDPTRTYYFQALSPDTSRIVTYYMDAVNDDPASPQHLIVIHYRIDDFDGTFVDSSVIRIPLPRVYKEYSRRNNMIRMSDDGLFGLETDNAANIYVVLRPANDTLEVMKYPLHKPGAPEILRTAFPNKDFPAEDYCISVEHKAFDPLSSTLNVTASHRKYSYGPNMLDLLFTSYDFSAKTVRSFSYCLNKDSLDKLIDQNDLEDYEVDQSFVDRSTGRTVLALKKRIHGNVSTTYTSSPDLNNRFFSTYSHYVDYCNGIVLFGFDASGKPLFSYAMPKKQNDMINYCFRMSDPSKLDIFYTDRHPDPEGLYTCELDIANSSLSIARNILQFESDAYVIEPYTVWTSPHSAIMFAAGSATSGGQILYRKPIIFRLTTP